MSGDIPPDEIVYVATGANASDPCFHTGDGPGNLDCSRVDGREDVRAVRRGDRPDLRQCKRCSGEWKVNQKQEQFHPHDDLLDMTPEEAGLSPIRADREVGGL